MGLDFDQLFPARFLKAGELRGRDVTLTITSVEIETLEGDGGKKVKGILSFKGTPKQLVLNKTNGLCIRGMFGRDTSNWVGKRVTFFPAPISFGDSDIAIRVRGSPDIEKAMDVEIKLARKKPKTMRMEKTGQAQAKGQAAPPPPSPEHLSEPEPFPDLPDDAGDPLLSA